MSTDSTSGTLMWGLACGCFKRQLKPLFPTAQLLVLFSNIYMFPGTETKAKGETKKKRLCLLIHPPDSLNKRDSLQMRHVGVSAWVSSGASPSAREQEAGILSEVRLQTGRSEGGCSQPCCPVVTSNICPCLLLLYELLLHFCIKNHLHSTT